MLNNCNFIGHLGADVEVRSFQNGNRVANFRLACTEKWKEKDSGERREKTEWVSVAVFAKGLVGIAEQYLKKGSKVYVSGKLQTRQWQDKEGNDRYSTEIVLQGFGATLLLLDGKPDGANSGGNQSSYGGSSGGQSSNDLGDEINF